MVVVFVVCSVFCCSSSSSFGVLVFVVIVSVYSVIFIGFFVVFSLLFVLRWG